ncbi:hypothetical protein AGIG_G8979 [Arapaima gigas]
MTGVERLAHFLVLNRARLCLLAVVTFHNGNALWQNAEFGIFLLRFSLRTGRFTHQTRLFPTSQENQNPGPVSVAHMELMSSNFIFHVHLRNAAGGE